MANKHLNNFFSDIEATPPVLQNSYYPSLDGLRGIAILLVVVSHFNLISIPYYDVIFNGKLGVLIFFVLSGFLITTLCIKEKVATKNISLKNFYIRRALRIFPVAYLFLLVLLILNFAFKLDIHYIQFLGAGLYLMNFSSYFRTHHFSWYPAHFWSLAVEEQFYLAVPFILKKKFKAYLTVILSIIFLLPLLICLQYAYPRLNTGILYAFTHFIIKFQAIAVGCLFSVLAFKYDITQTGFVKYKWLLNLLAIFLLFFIQYDDLFSLRSVFTGLAVSFLAGYMIISNITPAKDAIFWLLNTKLLKIIGVLSYSMYIWQQIFTSNDPKLPAFMVTSPYNIICIVGVSCLSYYFYESYFLRLKSKFSKVKTREPVPAV